MLHSGLSPFTSRRHSRNPLREVFASNGDYMWSLGKGLEPGNNDRGDALRVRLGGGVGAAAADGAAVPAPAQQPPRDVPLAVEMAMVGMRRGAVRRVEVPTPSSISRDVARK